MITKCGSQCRRRGCPRVKEKHVKIYEAKLGMNFTSKLRKQTCAAGAVSKKSETTVNSRGSCYHPRALRMHAGRGLYPVLSPALRKWAGQCQLATKHQGQKLGSERIARAASLPITVKKKKKKAWRCEKRNPNQNSMETPIIRSPDTGSSTSRTKRTCKERCQMQHRHSPILSLPNFIAYIFSPSFYS